jgi:peptidoglycan-associated lipoprotein
MVRTLTGIGIAGVIALGLASCATKTYVGDEVSKQAKVQDAKIGEVQSQVESTQQDVNSLKQSQADQDTRITEVSDTAREALSRAQEAGKLAQGKFLYEVVLTDDAVHFGFDSAKLSDEAKKALDDFAQRLKSENRNVYIEIQGFTDSTGPQPYNLDLGEHRAEAVKRYLAVDGGVPLHRMNTISYGEDKPIAPNDTREGRAKNRRVALVVLS